MQRLLQVDNLTIGRDGAPLLAGLSFALAAGEALILQGPNGAGKTTLLRSLAGFIPPISGQVLAEDPAFAGHLDGVKAQLSVAENLSFWASVHGGGAIETALTDFDLMGLRHRPARALSAGQKRRLGLARLVLSRRRLWLLDEPTVSLDKASVARFAGVVQKHLAGGGAALIATHTDLGLDAPVLDIGPYRLRGGVKAVRDLGAAEAAPGAISESGHSTAVNAQSQAIAEAGSATPPPKTNKQDPFGAGW